MLLPVAAFLGIGAFALPLATPWSLALCLATAISSVLVADSRAEFLLRLAASSILFLAAASVVISAPLVAAILAAATLAKQRPELAAGVLVLQSSYSASIQALLANYLHILHIEAAGPALISSLVLLFFYPTFSFTTLGMVLAVPVIAHLAQGVVSNPSHLMLACAVPSLVFAFAIARPALPAYVRKGWAAVPIGLVCICILGWSLTPPRTPSAKYFLLPKNAEVFEAKFYEHYASSARFAGINLKEASDPESIPDYSLVLLPWLTVPLYDDKGDDLIPKVKELANARRWTVVLVGEHTNLTGVRDRVMSLAGRASLRNDLSVPPNNSDDSGPLRVGDFRAWPHETILNRGASLEILGLLDRILLEGDGWWAEPDIGEWLWVGDYLWRPSDRHGRLTLAASIDINKARWVVIGDTSPLINRQLVADPRGAAQIIQMASLWPLFIKDLLVLGTAAVFLLGVPVRLTFFLPLVLLTVAAAVTIATPHEGKWRAIWLRESGFDERNFNNVVSASPGMVNTTWTLVRRRENSNGALVLPAGPVVLFGLIDREVSIGTATLNRCHRLGALKTDEGPYLMDAQACAVSGDAAILIGDRNGAAAIRISREGGDAILVLDRRFLSQNSAPDNAEWLLRQFQEPSSK